MSTPSVPRVHRLRVVDATAERLAGYGILVGTEVPEPRLCIPFYEGTVVEGNSLPFSCEGQAVLRTARVHPRDNEVRWLERHLCMTQLFVGLGDKPFVMVLARPTHDRGAALPGAEDLAAFRLRAGHGVLLHLGAWHDFPMACEGPVTILTVSSAEVIEALASTRSPREMDRADVFKIDVRARLGVRLEVELPAPAGRAV
jgi:ureidoglycolate lyase